MALAGTPVQPVKWKPGKFEVGGEGFDLLPLTTGNVDVEPRVGGSQRDCG